jgi:phosphoglycerate dehydrogenase-like enzyme
VIKNIVVLIPVNEQQKILLENKAPFAKFTYTDSKHVQLEQIKNANIIIGNPPAFMLNSCNDLQFLQLQSAGANEYASLNVLKEEVLLATANGAYGLAISEYMVGVLLELYKKLHLYRDNQNKKEWSNLGEVKSIYNSTALIVGLGDIGGEFAKRIKALGGYTIGIRRKDCNKPDYLDELYLMDKLTELLPRADIVSLSLPETNLTKNIINEKTLKLMKKDAVIINVGRGSAIDTDALCNALEKEQLLGAALDVTEPEPLLSNHPLWNMKNVIITPHISGGFSLKETHERIVAICANNLEAFLNDKKVINIVNRIEGY